MRITPRGSAGIAARIAEIEGRLDRVLGERPKPAAVVAGDNGLSGDPIALSGSIGRGGSGGGTEQLRPLNPFGGDASVDVPRAPIAMQPMIRQAAETANVEPALLEALVSVESNFNPTVVSSAGAKGLAQLMPGTASALGVKDPFDPAQNLAGGARYLSQMLKEFNGDTRLALAAYNAGPGAVRRSGGIPPYRETQNYVRKVMARYEGLKQAS